jgi:hypothetical protein
VLVNHFKSKCYSAQAIPRSKTAPTPGCPGCRNLRWPARLRHGPDLRDRLPNPVKKTAVARIRAGEEAITAAEAAGTPPCLSCAAPGSRPGRLDKQPGHQCPGRPRVEAAWRELEEAEPAAAAIPAWVPLGTLAPDMARLEAEVKQITHAIRMAAYNAETALACALVGQYARAGYEAYALIRETLTVSGDICLGDGELLIRLDPLTAPPHAALAALCDQLSQAQACYPGTDLVLR